MADPMVHHLYGCTYSSLCSLLYPRLVLINKDHLEHQLRSTRIHIQLALKETRFASHTEVKEMKKNNKKPIRGCIKASRGPWVVHRATKKGVITSLRFPTDRERHNNMERERKRREITRRIYEGLRAHGNYKLPKYADNNDLLKALCGEAGWQVDEDGTLSRKNCVAETVGRNITRCSQISSVGVPCDDQAHFLVDGLDANGGQCVEETSQVDVDLTLSLALPSNT